MSTAITVYAVIKLVSAKKMTRCSRFVLITLMLLQIAGVIFMIATWIKMVDYRVFDVVILSVMVVEVFYQATVCFVCLTVNQQLETFGFNLIPSGPKANYVDTNTTVEI